MALPCELQKTPLEAQEASSWELAPSAHPVDLGPASLVCKGPDGQYFWLCGLPGSLLSVGTTQLCRGSRKSGRGNRCGELLPQGCSWPSSVLGSQTLAILPSSMICRQSCEAGRRDTLEERGPALPSTGWPTPVTCQGGPCGWAAPGPLTPGPPTLASFTHQCLSSMCPFHGGFLVKQKVLHTIVRWGHCLLKAANEPSVSVIFGTWQN